MLDCRLMHVFLMRHADAVSPEGWRKGDSSRPLSDQGRDRLDKAIPRLRESGFSVDEVLTSPFARAQDTAARVASALRKTPEPVPSLAAGCTFRAYRDLLRQKSEAASVLVVGHMPEIAVAASHLSGEPSFLENGLSPGEIVSIEAGEDGRGTLNWRRRLEDW